MTAIRTSNLEGLEGEVSDKTLANSLLHLRNILHVRNFNMKKPEPRPVVILWENPVEDGNLPINCIATGRYHCDDVPPLRCNAVSYHPSTPIWLPHCGMISLQPGAHGFTA